MSRSNEFEHRDLVIKAIKGDTEAFEQLYRNYTKNILYHARRYISDQAEAEDAAQEAIVEMYRNISTLKNPDAFLPWMYRLTKFVCLKHVRSLKTGMGHYGMTDIDDYVDVLADETGKSEPSELMVEGERVETIKGIIDRLPEKQRETLILYYYEGLSYREIAAALDSKPSTVSTNIMKAKKRIAQELKLESFIAMAITADVGAKLAGVNIPAFQAACNLGVAKTAAAGLGGVSTLVGQQAGQGVQGAAQASTAASTGVSAAAAAGVIATVTAISPTPDPAFFVPDADITFSGGACECGHVNPHSATLYLSDNSDSIEAWEILAGEDIVLEGTGSVVELAGMPDGVYTINYVVVSAEGDRARSYRAFIITAGETDGLYL